MGVNSINEQDINRHLAVVPENIRIGDDFFLIDDFRIPPMMSEAYRVESLTTILFCMQGTAFLRVDMKEYDVKAPCMITLLYNKIIELKNVSDDFACKAIIASNRFFDSLFTNVAERQQLAAAVVGNPVLDIGEGARFVISEFFRMLKNSLADVGNPTRMEVAKHLMLACYFGFGNRFMIKPERQVGSRQSELLEEFINLLEKHYKEHHDLEFYAEHMFITPKYLSSVIQKVSGRSASDWIKDVLVLEIKTQLNCTQKTVQQISDDLNFPSQSFLGKFFKRFSGMSPREYREKRNKFQ